jgi:hypothetical protein
VPILSTIGAMSRPCIDDRQPTFVMVTAVGGGVARRPRSLAIVEASDMAAAALHFDRMLGFEIYARRNHLVARETLAMAIVANARLGGRDTGNAHAYQCDGSYRFQHSGSP